MFEAQVAYYLNKYLGKYVYGLDPEKLKISVWRGDVQLSNLQLKPEALQDLNLPISVKAGLLGKLTLKVPWTKLGREPVIVEFDRLYILAAPRTDEETEIYQDPDEFEQVASQRALQAKRQRLQNAEMDWMKELEARAAHSAAPDEDGKGGGNMIANLIQTILGNLQLRITNVHIRYEDHLSNPGHKFAVGVMFKEISAHTVDDKGRKAFITSNVLQSLRKAVTLQQLAVYFNVDQPLLVPPGKWTSMDVPEWDLLFLPPDSGEEGADSEAGIPDTDAPPRYQYLLCPVDGSMVFIRRDRSACKTAEDARQEMDLKLVNITVAFSRAHYLNTQKLLTGFEDYQARAGNIHFRPKCRPVDALTSKLWWRYAFHGVKKRLSSSNAASWDVASKACKLRRRYIPAYVRLLQQNKLGGDESIAEMDAQLPDATIMLFRKMAHAKVELAKRQEAVRATKQQQQPQQQGGGGGWWGWWSGGSRPPPDKDKDKQKEKEDKAKEAERDMESGKEHNTAKAEGESCAVQDSSSTEAQKESGEKAPGSETAPGSVKEQGKQARQGGEPEEMKSGLDAEEWKKLEELLGSHVVEDRSRDTPFTLRLRLRVHVQSASLMLHDADGVEAVAGSLKAVTGCFDSFPSTKSLQLAVKMANICCPEGTLLSTGFIQDIPAARTHAAPPPAAPPPTPPAGPSPEGQAMSLEYTHKPQDGTADGLAKLLVAPSYVTYNAAAIHRIIRLFSSQEAVQLARLQAQAAVRAEQIRRMAELRLKALSTEERKPKLKLSLKFHAPKVALPCKGVTLLMDLGLFTLDTHDQLAASLPPEEAALYECFNLGINNISAYLVNRDFNWPSGSSLTTEQDLSSLMKQHLGGEAGCVQPVLERFAMNAVVQAATTMHPRYPAIKADVKAAPLRLQVSPSRYQHIMVVVRSFLPAQTEQAAGQADNQDLPTWMLESEYSTPVQVLSWEGLTSAKWSQRKLFLFRGRVYVTKQKEEGAGGGAPELVLSRSFWQADRVVTLPPEHVGNVNHVIALCPPGIKRSEVAEREESLVLRCSSRTEVSDLRIRMMQSKSQMQVLAGLLPTDDVDSMPDEVAAKADVFDAMMRHKTIVQLTGEIEEIAVVVSGREPVRWWPSLLDGTEPPTTPPTQSEPYPAGRLAVLGSEEVALMEMRLSTARVNFTYSPDKLHANIAMRAMDMEDLLVGRVCPSRSKMAHSMKQGRVFSHQLGVQEDMTDSPERPAPMPSTAAAAAAAQQDTELVQLTFTQYNSQSEEYKGLDTELTLKLNTLSFLLNRPTVAALMGMGKDMAEVNNALQQTPPQPPPPQGEVEDTRSLDSASSYELDPSIQRSGGNARTIFRMTVTMRNLKLHAEYEGMPDINPLCVLSVENFEYALDVHPSTIHIVSSLGNVVGQYTQLGYDSPYLTICDMRAKTESSLIKVDYQLHAKEESYHNPRVPDGLPFHSVSVHTNAVQLVFLRRFLNEFLEYLSVMLSMCAPGRVKVWPEAEEQLATPTPIPTSTPALSATPSSHTPAAAMAEAMATKLASSASSSPPPPSQNAVPLVVLLDVTLGAPIITLPYNSTGASYVDFDLGTLEVHNEVVWEPAAESRSHQPGSAPPMVLMDRMNVVLSGVGVVVAQSATQRGDNLIKEMGQGLQVHIRRCCATDNGVWPPLQTSTVVPTLKASLLDSEYRTILSVLAANFSEPADLPAEVALVHRHVLWQPAAEAAQPVPSTPASKSMPGLSTAFSPRSHSLPLSPTSPRPPPGTPQRVSETSPLHDCHADLASIMAALKDRSSIKATVSIAEAELELLNEHSDGGRPVPLAAATFSNFWLVYHGSAKGNMYVAISLPSAKARDMRPGVPREHSVVLSTHSLSGRISPPHVHATQSHGCLSDLPSSPTPSMTSSSLAAELAPSLLTLEYRSIRSEPTPLQVVRLRLQRPTLMADIGFMMAVLAFVTPGSTTQGAQPPPFTTRDVHLGSTPHQARSDLWLSPEFRLLADAPGIRNFEYDGAGRAIILPAAITVNDALPLIVVGNNSTLRFRNVRIVNSSSLSSCLSMAPGAQLLFDRADGVELLDSDTSIRAVYQSVMSGLSTALKQRYAAAAGRQQPPAGSSGPEAPGEQPPLGLEGLEPPPSQFVLEVHTLGMALHLVDTTQLVQKQQQAELQARQRKDGIMARGGLARSGPAHATSSLLADAGLPSSTQDYVLRMLAVYVDLSAKYSSFSGQQSAEAELHNLSIATQTNLLQYDPGQRSKPGSREISAEELEDQVVFGKGVVSVRSSVLEPCDIYAKFQLLPNKQELKVKTSDITLKMSPDVLQLVTHLQSRLLAPIIHAPTDQPLARCDRFERLWASHSQIHDGPPYPRAGAGGVDVLGADRGITLWRPQPPTGYVMLGDVVTAGSEQPSNQVAAVAVNSGLVTYPVGYEQVWASPEGVTVWRPIPPSDYVSLGCIVSLNEQQPRLKMVGCVHRHAVVDSFLGECMMLSSNGNLWCVQNAAGTFEVSPPESHLPQVQMYDLRSPVGVPPANTSSLEPLAAAAAHLAGCPKKDVPLSLVAQQQYHRQRRAVQERMAQQRLQAQAVEFERVWWDKDTRKATKVSFWRPVPPPGYMALGDCMVVGLHAPPMQVTVLKASDSAELKAKGIMPVLSRPKSYSLVWQDENKARLGRGALTIWRPVPREGYVAMGMIATNGEQPPGSLRVCCVRQDLVSSLKMTQPHWHMEAYRERTEVHAWRTEDSTGCFLLERANVKEVLGYQLRVVDEEDATPSTPSASGMNVNIEIGRTSLLLRNTLKVPILELEAQKSSTAIIREGPNVLRCVAITEVSLYSYNGPLQAWEPVVEPWEMLLHLDLVSGAKPVKGMVPGLTMRVNSTQGTVHVSLAHAAINSLLEGMAEWRQLEHLEDATTFRRQLAAAEGASIESTVRNSTGQAAQMRLQFGTHQSVVDLPPGVAVETQQPLPPISAGRSLAVHTSPSPIRMFVDVLRGGLAGGGEPGERVQGKELFVVLHVRGEASDELQNCGWGLTTRAVVPSATDASVDWNERFLVSLPLAMVEQLLTPAEGNNRFNRGDVPLEIDVAVYDGSGENGLGVCMGRGRIPLQYGWLERQVTAAKEAQQARRSEAAALSGQDLARTESVAVGGPAGRPILTAEIKVCVDASSVDASWQSQTVQAQRSNMGQRAIRLAGSNKWVPLSATATFHHTSSAVLPIGLGDGMALHTTYEGGRRSELLRALCQLTNRTKMPLEVGMRSDVDDGYEKVPLLLRQNSTAAIGDVLEEEVFENERFVPFKNWSARNLLLTERQRYSRGRNSQQTSQDFPAVPLPAGWEWEGPWTIEKGGNVDEHGWAYAWDWKACTYPVPQGGGTRKPTDFVRRRRWVRRRRKVTDGSGAAKPAVCNARILGVVAPGATLALPDGWKTDTHQLLVRPVHPSVVLPPERQGGGQVQGEAQRLPGEPPSHHWSFGASEGKHSVLLGSLEEGAARLVSCRSCSTDAALPFLAGNAEGAASSADPDGSEGADMAELPGDCWFSLLTDCERLADYAGETLQDWSIVAHPPLIIRNLLPVPANYIVWERSKTSAMTMRQKGRIDAGGGEHIYTADMRTQVLLTFFPEGTAAVSEPITLSEGYYSNDSGVSGRQRLATDLECSYQNSQSTHNLRICVERDVSSAAMTGNRKSGQLDPGAAVAVGFPLTVRLYVPLWIENATQLPICAGLAYTEPTPSYAAASAASLSDSSNKVEELALRLRVLDTNQAAYRNPPPPKPYSYVQIPPNSVELLCFNHTDTSRQHGVVFSIMGSQWTDMYMLQAARSSGPMEGDPSSASGAAALGSVAKFEPALLRAHSKDNCVYEVSLRLVAAGVLWRRSYIMRLETHVIVSNRTGFRLLITPPDLKTPPQQPPTGPPRQYPSRVELPAGAVGVPLHQNITHRNQKLEVRTYVVRLAPPPGSHQDTTPQLWSEPFTVQYPGSGNTQVLVPVYMLPKSRTPLGPRGLKEMEMREAAKKAFRALYTDPLTQGAQPGGQEVDVALTKAARPGEDGNLDYMALVMNVAVQFRGPGCLHVVLASVGGEPRNVLMNCTPATMKYRQSVSLAVWQTLQPYSTQGFACPYQVTSGANEVELRDASPYASATHPAQVFRLDPGTRQNFAGTVSAPSAAGGSEDSGKLEQRAVLPLHDGKYHALVQVVELAEAVLTPAGLKRVPGSTSSSLGRTYLDYQLRVVPRPPDIERSMLSVQALGQASDGSPSSNETRIILNIPKLDISLVDAKPQELILLSVDELEAEYRVGCTVGVDYTQYMVQVKYVQLDDLILGTPHPVVLLPASAVPSINNLMPYSASAAAAAARSQSERAQDPVLFMSFVFEPGRRRGMLTCPCIVVSLTRLRVAVAETLLWRMYNFYSSLNVGRLSSASDAGNQQQHHASSNTDLFLYLQLLNVDDIPLSVSFKSDVAARPKFALQGNMSMGLDFANIDDLPLVIPGMQLEHQQVRQSQLAERAVSNLKERAIAIAFNLVRASGVGGLASKILAAASASVAQLGESHPQRTTSMREVRDAGEGLVEGGKVFMKGLFKGVTGVIREPLSGAERGGITGFTTGVVKGLVGVASAPVSGMLGGISKVTEGIDATAKKVAGMSQSQSIPRRRLPRAFRGDRLLRPFEGRAAMGQALVQLTSPSAYNQASNPDANVLMQLMDLGDMPPPEYWQDAYDTHFCLPGDLVLVVTNHRLLCVHSPGFEALEQQVVGLGRDCDTVPHGQEVWQLLWPQILALEVVYPPEPSQGPPHEPPSVVLVHRRGEKPEDLFVRIQCKLGSNIARDVYQAIGSARRRYFLAPKQQVLLLEDDPALTSAQLQQQPASVEVRHFLRVWWGFGQEGKKFSVWRPMAPAGYAMLGDVAVPGWEQQPQRAVRVYKDDAPSRARPGANAKLAFPEGYMLVYRDSGTATSNRPLTIWSPIAPSGYTELGHVVLSQIEEPPLGLVRCVSKSQVKLARYQQDPVCLLSSHDLREWKCSIWGVDNACSTFLSDRMHAQPAPAKALAVTFK